MLPTDGGTGIQNAHRSADAAGYVRATVERDGRLHALHINPHALHDLSAAQLAAACLEAVARAQSMRSRPGRR